MHFTGRGLETEIKRNPTDLGETCNGPQRTPPVLNGRPNGAHQASVEFTIDSTDLNGPQRTSTDLNGPHLSQQNPNGHQRTSSYHQRTPTDTNGHQPHANRHQPPPGSKTPGVHPGNTWIRGDTWGNTRTRGGNTQGCTFPTGALPARALTFAQHRGLHGGDTS